LCRPKRVWRRKYAAPRVLLSSEHLELRDEIRDVSISLDMTNE
jgi:hypothetical protein